MYDWRRVTYATNSQTLGAASAEDERMAMVFAPSGALLAYYTQVRRQIVLYLARMRESDWTFEKAWAWNVDIHKKQPEACGDANKCVWLLYFKLLIPNCPFRDMDLGLGSQ